MNINNITETEPRLRKKKEIVAIKYNIIQWLLSNDFRCKNEDGKFMSKRETDDILILWSLEHLKRTKQKYNENVVKPRQAERIEARCIFNACLHKSGLSHWLTKDVIKRRELA